MSGIENICHDIRVNIIELAYKAGKNKIGVMRTYLMKFFQTDFPLDLNIFKMFKMFKIFIIIK